MSDAAFSAALDKLSAFLEQSGGDLALASAHMAQESNIAELTELGELLAGVRWIDEALYNAMFAGNPAAPPFAKLIEDPRPWFLPDRLVAQGDGRYGWASGAALSRERAWQERDPESHASWHRQLARHFEESRSGVPSLDLIHHANIGNLPDIADLFEEAFAAADCDFDVPRLNAILETIRIKPPARETPLWFAVTPAETYFAGRTLFRRDYQLTTRFFERDDAFKSFLATLKEESFLAPIEVKPFWIWHMHASGGVGKTTFLRWLIARVLLPRPGRAICARIDLDDYRLNVLVTYPMRAIADILRQIDKQRPSDDLRLIVRNLDDASREAGWNDGLLQSVAIQLARVRIDMPVVVVLDTLEDATRTQAAWLRQLVEVIARLRTIMPAVTLVLSGRYDVSEIVPPALTSQMIVHELSRFNRDEANAYLERIECIASSDIREAVLERVCADDIDQAPAGRRFNPFKLYLLGEIVRGDPNIDAGRIRKIESVDLAYLIERVILRIDHQALRWLIRYAVVARELDLQFLDQVLLSELRDALTGKTKFDLVAHDEIGGYRGQDIWRPDPKAAEKLNARHLLDDLRGYAADRGWISVDTSSAVVRLHPEVIEPTRKLLAGQKVWLRLHERALKLAQGLAVAAKTPADWVSAKSMEIFHEYQRDPVGGTKAWRKAVVGAQDFGSSAVEGIAKEILGKDYESCPAALHAEANLVIARVLIEQALSEGSENVELLTRIVSHLETACAQDEHGVDPAFRDLPNRLAKARSDPDQLLTASVATGDANALGLVYSDLALAWRLSVLRNPEFRKLAHQYVARARLRQAGKCMLTIGDVHLALWQNAIARSLSDTRAARQALTSVRIDRNSSPTMEYSIVLAKAANALLDYDLAEAQAQLTASKVLSKFDRNGAQAGWSISLRMDLAIAMHDPFAALAVAAEAPAIVAAGDRMGILYRSAFAAAIACEFDRAENYFREAEALIEATDNAASSGHLWESLKWRMRAALLGMRHPNLAEKLLSSGIGSGRGRQDLDHEAEIAAFRVWIELLRGNEHAAGAQLPPPSVLANAPPGIAWALALATIGLADPSRTAELAAILDGPLPAGSDFYLALKYAAERRTRIPKGLIDAKLLASRMPQIAWLSPGAEVERAGQADLLYLLNRDDLARKRIGDPFSGKMSEANLLTAIEYERCRQRRGLRPEFERLWRYAERKNQLKGNLPGLAALTAVLSSQEWLSAGKWDEASGRALEARHHFWEQRESSGWSQRIWEIAAIANQKANEARGNIYLDNARAQQAEVGLAPLDGLAPLSGLSETGPPSEAPGRTDWVHREVVEHLAQEQFDIHAPAWDRSAIGSWVREWLRDPEAMRDRLTEIAWFAPVPPGSRVQIDIERKLAGSLASALPWELARVFDDVAIVRRTIGRSSNRRPQGEPRISPGATVLIGRTSEPLSFAVTTSLTQDVGNAYRRSAPGSSLFVFDAVRSDIFAEMSKLSGEAVDIIHIVAVMQEAKGGFALDFRSSGNYSERMGGQQQISARHLQSMLGSLRSRPLVILDIEATDNEAAAAEMLIQRNAFAEELYDPGFMAGLIATGLASYGQRQAAELMLIEALSQGANVGQAFSAIRDAAVPTGGSAADLYWHRASALWCDDTEAQVRPGTQRP